MDNAERKRAQGAKGGPGGFTLIETVITLVVLSIAAVGVLTAFSVGIRGSADPLLISQAAQLAQEKMDTIIGDREANGFAAIVPAAYGPENPVPGFAGFSRSVSVFCVDAPALNTDNGNAPPCASGYAHVSVTVTQASLGSITLDTLLTNY